MITNTLTQECPFEFAQEKKVGHLRGDFASGSLANTWFANQPIFETLRVGEKKEIQAVCNTILFETFNTFAKVVAMCGAEGYDNERNLFTQSERFDYWIRLNPVKDDYSIYVHTYKK